MVSLSMMFPDLHSALFTGGTYVHVQGNTGLLGRGFKVLHKHIAPGAMHNSGDIFDEPKCHPKTRLAALGTVMHWIQGLDGQSSSILWLYGSAGIGKTAFARSIAEQCEELGLLLATFFFSGTVEGRNDTRQFVSTIAYQLAQNIPTTLQYIERAVEKDPSIFDKALNHQVRALIVQPLKLSNSLTKTSLSPLLEPFVPSLLVIDGLDECDNGLAQLEVLKILGDLLLQHELPLKILIISRPGTHIRSAFETGSLSKLAIKLPLDDLFEPDNDVRSFLSSEFEEIKENHPSRSTIPDSWPPESIIELLVKKSAGQFIFAAAVIKYVASLNHFPHERLKDILALCDIYIPGHFLEPLDESRRLPHLLVSSDFPTPHVSEAFSSSSTWSFSSSSDNRNLLPLRRHSALPFPIHVLNADEERCSSSGLPMDRIAGLRHSMPCLKDLATQSCPIPGCGAIFHHLDFGVHLHAHKEIWGYDFFPGRSRGFVKQLGHKRHERDLLANVLARCLKSGIESYKVQEVAAPSMDGQDCWEMDTETDMDMEVEVDKGIDATEMEVD